MKPRPFQRVPLLAALALSLLLAAPFAHAMKLRNQNLTQLIDDSQSILFGTVTRVSDGIDSNNVPYTEVTIAVGTRLKGKQAEGSEYTFRQFGLLKPRSDGQGRMLVALTPEGFPRWHEGETVFAFLREPAKLTGLQTTAGVAQGKLSLINGELRNDFNNVGLFEDVQIVDSVLTDEHRSMLLQPGAVDAGTFIDLVGRAVEGNWIESGEMQ
jgi:hypothetical protein